LLDLPSDATPLAIFGGTTNFKDLVGLICEQTNLYAAQSGRKFETNTAEIHAFLGVNYIMSINKLPNLKS
jgi:hypothetical protein